MHFSISTGYVYLLIHKLHFFVWNNYCFIYTLALFALLNSERRHFEITSVTWHEVQFRTLPPPPLYHSDYSVLLLLCYTILYIKCSQVIQLDYMIWALCPCLSGWCLPFNLLMPLKFRILGYTGLVHRRHWSHLFVEVCLITCDHMLCLSVVLYFLIFWHNRIIFNTCGALQLFKAHTLYRMFW